ncbi:hypothetical protein HYFRA_00011978 [Hymenoscyphus fraxineus]|uniref:Enoyl reductase (ER) domain-containing protein n=1 Tax=Hymenoscyphus fraxineus TaxID=746836 RepID=A0A9N9PKC2_9HELO|nr:hypothetical protein HYFRA_00011978 [Hymenoscyphus fraxineus]
MASTTRAWQVFQNDTSKNIKTACPPNLVLNEIPVSTPGQNEVLVRMHAVGINFRDAMVVSGAYPLPTTPGLVCCCDGAGEVISVGPNSIWAVGDHIILNQSPDWKGGDNEGWRWNNILGAGVVQGSLTQYKVLSDDSLVRKPKNLSWVEAASLSCAGGTAMNTLDSIPAIKEGTTVLTQGTGGFAAAMGATVIATSSSDAKLQEAKKLGASHLINYKTHPDWHTEVNRLTNGRGVDLVADMGGASTIEQSIACIRQGGTAALVGFLGEQKDSNIVYKVVEKAITLRGILAMSQQNIVDMVELIEKKDLHPPIGEVFEFEDAPSAFAKFVKQDLVGKIVIKVD